MEPQERLAPVDLDAAAGVGALVLQHLVADPVGGARGPRLEPVALRSVDVADDGGTGGAGGGEHLEQALDVVRIVLAVASMVAMMGLVAARMPERMAALWPLRRSWPGSASRSRCRARSGS